MTETVELNGKEYEVIGRHEDGLPIIQGIATSTQDGVDEHGNPKINVNIDVPSIVVGATPGEVE